ncbi:unnamed protein product [Caenorhabditis bovis]|uniref:G-protein coupled receptors family 1 profile domain-containing protein n=1 Tax=Caenorhabditis bovis TaxID=2654633 RepID=A0A8S1F9E9_9PELO|nr:unnamed protein product [Caenorhabditis bovis]
MLDHELAALVIFLVSFSGALFNILALFTVLKTKALHNAFGALCFSHSIANFGTLAVFLGWVLPATLQFENTTSLFGKILGQIQILFWNACCYSHLVISFNRFVSISMPTKAPTFFNFKNTTIMIAVVWCMSIAHIIPYFWYAACFMAYDPASWTWNFADTPCGYVITTYTDYYTSVGIFVIMSSLDLLTFTLLVVYNKHVSNSKSSNTAKADRRMELRFFVQSVIQGALFFYEVFMFNYITTLNSNQWFVFFTSTFAWMICHCLDGLVVIIFHFRKRYLCINAKSAENSRKVTKTSPISTVINVKKMVKD